MAIRDPKKGQVKVPMLFPKNNLTKVYVRGL